MISADFQGFVASHNDPDFLGCLMTEQTNISSSAFLPLGGSTIKPEKLCTPGRRGIRTSAIVEIKVYPHLEKNVLIFFVSFCFDLFRELNHWLKLRVDLLILKE